MKKLALILFIPLFFFSFFFVYKNFMQEKVVHETENFQVNVSDVSLDAGKTIQFKINDTYSGAVSICELRVPDNYTHESSFPIFVWFAPGKGSYSIKNVPSFVNFSEYFVLALPYLDNRLPRLAIQDGDIDRLWDYDRAMLDYVMNYIPNLSEDRRIAAGFSSGAHFVASGLDRNWDGFTDFFTAYIIHEGGYAPKMTYKGIKPTDSVLLTYGDGIESYGKVVAEFMTHEHSNVTVYPIPNTGHEINAQTVEYVRMWVDITLEESKM